MNNSQIIFNASQELAEQGLIRYTGRTFKGVDGEGNEVEIKETEEIHTYKEWQNLGMQVQKGQKAIAKITIWNFTNKPSKAAREEAEKNGQEAQEKGHYYMKEAAFFSASQVAPAKQEVKQEVKQETNEDSNVIIIDNNYLDNLLANA